MPGPNPPTRPQQTPIQTPTNNQRTTNHPSKAKDQIPQKLLDHAGILQSDLPCRRCGYNLRGLNQHHRCPDCAAPVALSCCGDLLRFADPQWVQTLANGATLILCGTIIAIIGVGLLIATIFTAGNQLYAVAGSFLGNVIAFCGAWLITKPDPGGIGQDRYINDRRIVRLMLFLALGETILQILRTSIPLTPAINLALLLIIMLTGVCCAVGDFAKFTYFHKIARRIPHDKLAKRARTLRWYLAFSLGILVLGGTTQTFLMPGGAIPAPATTGGNPRGLALAAICAAACLTIAAILVFLVASTIAIFLVNTLRKELRTQAHRARQTWATNPR